MRNKFRLLCFLDVIFVQTVKFPVIVLGVKLSTHGRRTGGLTYIFQCLNHFFQRQFYGKCVDVYIFILRLSVYLKFVPFNQQCILTNQGWYLRLSFQ